MAKQVFTLGADIPRIAKELNEKVADVQKWAALKIFAGIMGGTPRHPVDTGYSRACWNFSIGEPDFSTLPKPEKRVPNSYPVPTASIPSNPDLKTIWLSNGVNYVKFLEEGSSRKAPDGFVRINVEKVRNELNRKAGIT